ncbi:hypothetical protein M413DRAFT_443805 [Hebeloma cylindrosporum]|uniref:Protein kinase domain-containing protein n=1 Tax=Hebeloma cylindrosporum TaxID=76867 RepID=A0A0C2YPL8_HEBCY|nr:hypothetical protein M413DRAFT_443805 [Hebeloma cylindrosporum h7]
MAALHTSEGVDQIASFKSKPAEAQEPSFPSKPTSDHPGKDETFSEHVDRVRTEMMYLGDNFDYLTHSKKDYLIPGGYEGWYGEPPYFYVKIIGGPGTLAGNILRWRCDLPKHAYNRNVEIIGDEVREVERKPMPSDDDSPDPDLEDCSGEVAKLPLIAFEDEKHFKKSTTYKQEIRYLLQCRGSPHVVQLLGRSEEGALVFPRFKKDLADISIENCVNEDQVRIQNIRRWMLDIIDGVGYLHSLGITHRDLTRRNILNADPLVICDLQCLNATRHCTAFEIDDGGRSKFSFASDVFALGTLLWELCFYNNPKCRLVLLDNPPPPPFRDIFVACTLEKPEDRPTLMQLRAMYEAIG